MKINKLIRLPFFFIMLFNTMLVAQTRKQLENAAGDIIDGLLASSLGPQYMSMFVIDVDSVLGNMDLYMHPVEDPYGTLKHCFIFIGGRESHRGNFLGVYKDGEILWRSDTTILGRMPELFAVADLNRSGQLDIVVESSGTNWGSQLWIFSWDGHVGRRINAVDNSGESVLQSVSHSFQLFDASGDGIIEIRDGNVQDGSETWSWNGSEYGKWPDTPHLPSTTLWPRNKIDILVKCAVNGSKTYLEFDYTVENKPTSHQQLYDMRIWGRCDSVRKNVAPVGWQAAYNPGRRGDFFSYWCNNPIGQVWRIPPGETASGFITLACGIPAIVQYDAQGYNQFPNYKLMTDQQLMELEKEDETTNSVHGLTVAPVNPPSPFVPINLLDTLTGYTTQFRSLGWIKDQTTANKYLGYFSSAKTSLQQNNIASTRATLQQVLQDANVDSTANITSEAYALIRYNTEYLLSQLPVPVSGLNVKLTNSTGTKLLGGSLQYYEGSWKDAVNNNDGTFFVSTTAKTISLRMTYEYGTQTKSNVTVGPDTVAFQTVNTQIKLQDSKGNAIDTGLVQYYAGARRVLGTTTNGTATKELLPVSYSFRMTYAYASNDKQQDLSTNSIVIFQTVNAGVQLQNSQGTLIHQGTVQYYSGAWRDFGVTAGGAATKELLPNNYSFRMTYAYASKDKQQDIGTNATVVFQTVKAIVQLQNSQGALIDQGTVQYYAGAWRDFGVTTGGVAAKELLPNTYSFRMTYAYASKDKQQDIGANPIVVFQTVNATVQLKNSQGNLIDQGTVQYYSGTWRSFGTTSNGIAAKELLPNTYSFRMTYEYVSLDKSQDISANNTVGFSTVLCTIRVKNSQSQPVDGALASYYSGAWCQIGTTVNGEVTKELLPANLTFRVTYGTTQQDKTQNLSTNNVVEFTIQP
jgi:hypothetical protein